MAFWNVEKPFNQDKVSVGSIYFNAVNAVNVDATTVSPNAEGRKIVPAGLFIAQVNGTDRFLPRAKATEVVESGTTQAISVDNTSVFLAGDMLYHLEADGLLTVEEGTAGNTITVRFTEPTSGLDVAYTHTQVGATLAELTAELLSALNSPSSALSEYARFDGNGTDGEIVVHSQGTSFTIAGSATGTATIAVTQLDFADKLVGTIASVDPVAGVLNLAAVSGQDLNATGLIGTKVDRIYGLYNHSVDFTNRPYCDLKVIERCDRVYKSGLPYYDGSLKARFPNMIFVN